MAAVKRVEDPEVPRLLEKIYKVPAPKAPREDLVAAFLTGIKGLNQPPKVEPAEGPSRLGVLDKDNQGLPNGRRLIDDVVDIELQALAGAIRTGTLVDALAAGDGVDSNDVAFDEVFPYVALPHSGSGPAASGFGNGSGAAAGPDAAASPSPDTTPSPEVDDPAEEADTSATAGESDGVSTGVVVGGIVLALLVGLAAGAAVSRRRGPAAG